VACAVLTAYHLGASTGACATAMFSAMLRSPLTYQLSPRSQLQELGMAETQGYLARRWLPWVRFPLAPLPPSVPLRV
jgi:hypothetical protein